MFKDKYPSTWTFHRSTCRSEFNTLNPQHGQALPEGYKEYLSVPNIPLPEPVFTAESFKDLLFARYSCRRFKNQPVQIQDLANVLFAGYGMRDLFVMDNSEFFDRTVPSGGGLYSLELYLLVINVEGLDPGIYHYVIYPALLEQIKILEFPKPFLQNLFMQQPYVADAPVIIIATSVIERTMKKYLDRGYRYILFEAGHCFQNMNLMASACQLGALNVGGFFDLDLCKTLGIDMEEEIPLYAMALGIPVDDRNLARMP